MPASMPLMLRRPGSGHDDATGPVFYQSDSRPRSCSVVQVIAEEVFDDGHNLHGCPLTGLGAAEGQSAVPGAYQQVPRAVGACGAQGLVQLQGLRGRDDAVIVAVQSRNAGAPGRTRSIGLASVALDRWIG
jgi:hypothetical protein